MPQTGKKILKGKTTECPRCRMQIGNSGLRKHQNSSRCIPLVALGRVQVVASAVGDELLGAHNEDAPAPPRVRIPVVHPTELETPFPPLLPSETNNAHDSGDMSLEDMSPAAASSADARSNDFPTQDAASQLGRQPIVDDIKVEPHPGNAANKKTQYFAYEDYTSEMPEPSNSSSDNEESNYRPQDSERQPWSPFRTRIDFEFAELMESIHPNARTLDAVVKLVRRIIKTPSDFTFVDGKHVTQTWVSATKAHGNGLQEDEIEATYQEETIKFPVWRVDMKDWVMEILHDKELRGELRFDAQRLYRHNGTEFERFINEPWTANLWWEIQGRLPPKGVPFAIIFYADKTKLSSMGTKKGYPVYVRCANLPSHIRNGEGRGGGRLVGWLPIVPEDSDKSGKTPFVDFKRVVWHASVYKILEPLFKLAGLPYVDVYNVLRILYPIILIIAADFEEQCVMAAVRGMGSDYPCPICLIPHSECPGLDKVFPPRTAAGMREVYNRALACVLVGDRDTELKSASLRLVNNCFWSFNFSGPYDRLGFDPLHAQACGVWRKHLLGQFLDILKLCGREVTSEIESNLTNMPRWRDLMHFTQIAEFREFSDGRKYEDMSKVLLFACHSVFETSNKRAYQWLLLARSYVDLTMWTTLLNHSTTTIQMGRDTLQQFERERKKYATIFPEKKWDFPKAHAQAHIFDNIESLGVAANTTTKGFEKMHKKPKVAWLTSNFKDLESILSRFTNREIAGMIIRNLIEVYDKETEALAKTQSIANELDIDSRLEVEPLSQGTPEVDWIHAGSPKTVAFLDLVKETAPEWKAAFVGLTAKLRSQLTKDMGLGRIAEVPSDLKVTMYRFLKVQYVSLEDSQIATDFIRFYPSFHGRPRYECALVQVADGKFMIARILTVFDVVHNTKKIQYALVLPMDAANRRGAIYRPNNQRCSNLKFKQLRSRELKESMLISTSYIIRGAFMVQDWGARGVDDQFIVMDYVDPDFFLRMRLHSLGEQLLGG